MNISPQEFNEAQFWGVLLASCMQSEDPKEQLRGLLDPQKTVLYVPKWVKDLVSSYLA
jgi:hypothetical protein